MRNFGKQIRERMVFGVLLFPLLLAGCPGDNNGGFTSGGGIPADVDLAVGSLPFTEPALVALFFDVLNFVPSPTAGAYPVPDVILDTAGSAISNPSSVILTSEDLVVCNGDIPPFSAGNYTIQIFRDYASLTDGAAADVILTNGGSGITNPHQCLVDEVSDTLVVANFNLDEVRIYPAFSSIPNGTDPVLTPVILNNAGSLISDPTGIFVAGDATSGGERDLYVANIANFGAGAPCVTIYRDIATLASADLPDVELDSDVSFFGDTFGTNGLCMQLTVGENPFDSTDTQTLFVTTLNGEVFLFENADTLTTNALPVAVLTGDPSDLSVPVRPLLAGDRLYVANYNVFAAVSNPLLQCPETPGVAGFSPNTRLINGQFPTVSLGSANAGLATASNIDVAGNALFIAGSQSCQLAGSFFNTSLSIYANAQGLSSFDLPGLVIPGTSGDSAELGYIMTLDAQQVTN